ncbi:hypothetical protein [uncultured Nocardioides sp.]|uniref:hypothetical protein n=1 Tax=uncultured Nocardioides sp. TaxID=198441 RepID=UPI00263128AD|nr:hypothetical protein [uncultured Nocardioides sp.]
MVEMFQRSGNSLTTLPMFWFRVVGYAYLCELTLREISTTIGLNVQGLDIAELLAGSSQELPAIRIEQAAGIFLAIYEADL